MKNFVNFINSINSIINGNNDNNYGELKASSDQFEDAKKLALILSHNTGVENMRINLNELRKEISKNHEGIFTSMALTFKWQGERVVLSEDYNFEDLARSFILSINGEKVVRIFWSVNAGLTCHLFRNLTPQEEWFRIHVILKAIWKWSHTSGKLIALNKEVIIGGIRIFVNNEKTTVMAEIKGETVPMMGHTLRGNLWWSCDPRLQEAIEVVKKAFRKPF